MRSPYLVMDAATPGVVFLEASTLAWAFRKVLAFRACCPGLYIAGWPVAP